MSFEENNSFETDKINNSQNVNTEEEMPFQTLNFYPEFLAKHEEKDKIKGLARVAGLSLIFITVIVNILNYILIYLPQYLGVSINTLQEIFKEPAFNSVRQILFSIIGISLSFVVVYKIAGFKISKLISFEKPKKDSLLTFFLLGVSFCGFSNVVMSVLGNFFNGFGFNYNVEFGENPTGLFGFILSLISTVFVPALIEEFALRGIVLGSLKKFGAGFAIITSSLLFGIMHGNFLQMPFAFMVGLILGYSTIKSGTIWLAVLIHGFNNLISVLFDYIPEHIPTSLTNIVYTGYIIFALLLGIAVLVLNKKTDFNLTQESTALSNKEKYKFFFTSIPIIIFIVISIIESLRYFV